MPTTHTLSAKDRVITWVMSKAHPTAVYDSNMGWWCMNDGDGGYVVKEPGLQELLIAIEESHGMFASTVMTSTPVGFLLGNAWTKGSYDLTQNLHNQPDSFYEALLHLIPNA